jgi:hypothetical protein
MVGMEDSDDSGVRPVGSVVSLNDAVRPRDDLCVLPRSGAPAHGVLDESQLKFQAPGVASLLHAIGVAVGVQPVEDTASPSGKLRRPRVVCDRIRRVRVEQTFAACMLSVADTFEPVDRAVRVAYGG